MKILLVIQIRLNVSNVLQCLEFAQESRFYIIGTLNLQICVLSGEEILFIIARSDKTEVLFCKYSLKNTYLNWINVMGDDDQLGFLLLNQLSDGVCAGLQEIWLLLGGDFLSLSLGLSNLLQSLFLGQRRLGSVFLQQLEQLHGSLFVQGLAELVNWWWNFQALLEDSLLPLDADVFGPSHEPGEITLGLDVLT